MRRALVVLGVAWILANLVGAWVSVTQERPYDLAFLHQPGKVGRIGGDWVHGWGTGLAMPLGVLAVAAVLTVLASFEGGAGRFAALLMALLGGVSLAFTLSNRWTYDRLDAAAADSTETAIIATTLALGVLLVLTGALTFITTPRSALR